MRYEKFRILLDTIPVQEALELYGQAPDSDLVCLFVTANQGEV